jgi:hypothetical protein
LAGRGRGFDFGTAEGNRKPPPYNDHAPAEADTVLPDYPSPATGCPNGDSRLHEEILTLARSVTMKRSEIVADLKFKQEMEDK